VEKVILTGSGGRVMWSYAVAAQCEKFEVRQKGKALSLVARLSSPDVFRLRQSPLMFEVPVGGGRWTWPIESLVIDGLNVTAKLQPMVKG
jgi:hypothetical protein